MGKLEVKQFELAEINTELEGIPNWNHIAKMVKEKTKLEKEIKKIKKDLEPKWIETSDAEVVSESNLEDSELEKAFDKTLENIGIYIGDIFDEDVPDEGVDYYTHFLVGDRMYYVEVWFGSYWVSEWSMRRNVIDSSESKIVSYKEIKDFEITFQDEDIFNAKYLEVK